MFAPRFAEEAVFLDLIDQVRWMMLVRKEKKRLRFVGANGMSHETRGAVCSFLLDHHHRLNLQGSSRQTLKVLRKYHKPKQTLQDGTCRDDNWAGLRCSNSR